MYLHSLRNFDVQGVIKLQTILDAILSFYWIVHGNGKYIFRYIQITFNMRYNRYMSVFYTFNMVYIYVYI